MQRPRSSTRRASARSSRWSASTSGSRSRRCWRLLRRRPRRRRRPGRPQADAAGDQAGLQEDQPGLGSKQMFNPQHLAFETAKNLVKTAIVAAIAAHALFGAPRRARRAGRHAAGAADPRDRLDGDVDRAARGHRLHRDRGRRLRLPEVPLREAAEDGPRGDQAGVQADGPPCRNQICAEAEGDGALPGANDGRSSHRRRDRHEPHPLLRRSEVRERECGTHRGRQGCRQPRVQDP